MAHQAGQANPQPPAQAPAQAAAGDGAGGVGVAQLQAQILALQAQLAQLAVAPQPVQAPAVQHVNPTTIAVPTPFSSGDIVEWLDRYVTCADANGWNEQQRLQRLPPYLSGQANLLYRRLQDNERDTWAHLRANLIAQFYPAETRTARTIEFHTTRHNAGETIDAYAYRLERKLDQAMPELTAPGAAQVRAEMLKSQFINGLPDPYRTRLYENPQLTFEQCQITARQLMAAAQLSLLSTPMTSAFLGMPTQTPSNLLPFAGANAFVPQVKPEPAVPANASRPYYPERDDRDRDA